MRHTLSFQPWLALVALLGACDEAHPPPSGAEAGGSATSAPPPERRAAVALALDQKVSYALMSDGTVRAWGINDHGALGNGRRGEDAATPVEVQGLTDVEEIAAGNNTTAQVTCARVKGSKVLCWGGGGQPMPTPDKRDQAVPIEVPALEGASQLSLGSNGHGCAVMAGGKVRCWGRNPFGNLGLGDEAGSTGFKIPTEVPGLEGVVEVRCGSNHTCVRLGDGTVKCFGHNASGEVQPVESGQKSSPVTVPGIAGATGLYVAGYTSCARTAEGLSCWGSGFREGPKAVEGLGVVVHVAGTADHLCAVEEGGAVKCWGKNDDGQLGDGSRRSSHGKAVAVQGVTGAVAVGAGERHSCAIVAEGKVVCWGYNQRGELGDGSLQDRLVPVEVAHLTAVQLPPPASGADDVKQAAGEQRFDDLPAGCTYQPKLAVSHRHLPGDTFEVRSAWAVRSSDKTLEIRLANYQLDPDDLYGDEPRAAQARISATFFRVELAPKKKKERKPLDLGTYELSTKNERYAIPSIKTRAHGFVLAGPSGAGAIELTHLGDDWVCGELRISTKNDKVTGAFAARVKEKK